MAGIYRGGTGGAGGAGAVILLSALVTMGAGGAQKRKPKPPEATAATATQGAPAKPVRKAYVDSFTIPPLAGDSQGTLAGGGSALCMGLRENAPLEAKDVIASAGATEPYVLEARGKRILIYRTEAPKESVGESLNELESRLTTLAKIGRFRAELTIPHAGDVTDLEGKLRALSTTDLVLTRIGGDKVRITGGSAPDCESWEALLQALRAMAWEPASIPPVYRVFHLSAGEATAALGGGGAGVGRAGAEAAPGGAAAGGGKAGAKKDYGAAGAGKAGEGEQTAAGKKDGDGKAEAGQGEEAGKETGRASGGAGSAAGPAGDFVVLGEPRPGDDGAIAEKRRILAMLDLPRPEMLINVWSSQLSDDHLDRVVTASKRLREVVNRYNDELQQAIYRGWAEMRDESADDSKFFDPGFYQYLTFHVMSGPQGDAGGGGTLEQRANAYLQGREAGKGLTDEYRRGQGICGAQQYCLGYSSLFRPLQPRLTDLLLAVIAANNPAGVVDVALDKMEIKRARVAGPGESCEKVDVGEDGTGKTGDGCKTAGAGKTDDVEAKPRFACFRATAERLFTRNDGEKLPNATGELRKAIADFLFHWKTAMQYPHEFSEYDLGQSAQALNAALAPLVDAFNRDIAAYQVRLRAAYARERCGGEKGFLNGGIVTVRTVSGKETVVDTRTQNYLDASEAPDVAQLASAIVQAGGTTFPVGLHKDLAAEAVMGALSAMQPSTAKIGRGLALEVMPRSLAGATSAEFDVTLKVAETAEPVQYAAGKAKEGADNTSRVATHNTTTRIRVESLKIVDVSSFWARLERGRTRFPLIPPFVELPYIGTLVGIPRKPAAEYHSSSAVISAVVIPTAADLAFGTRFESDRVAMGEGRDGRPAYRRTHSRRDLVDKDGEPLPIDSYHRVMARCFALGRRDGEPGCEGMTFEKVLNLQ